MRFTGSFFRAGTAHTKKGRPTVPSRPQVEVIAPGEDSAKPPFANDMGIAAGRKRDRLSHWAATFWAQRAPPKSKRRATVDAPLPRLLWEKD
jgi:hypothetical protein